MKLTRIQALDKTIKVWEERAESGSDRERKCYLCLYVCTDCPWHEYMGWCLNLGSPYDKWERAKTPRSRKLWATRCLEILYAIRELEVGNV